MTATNLKLVEITWKDHCTHGSSWIKREDLVEVASPLECISIGAIVKETPEYVSLIHTYTETDSCIPGVTILKSDITKRRKLYTK